MSFSPEIIFEDEQVVVINKPFGVVVNRAESVREETVQDWMENRLTNVRSNESMNADEEMRIFEERGGVAHRLDRDTSGVMILGKTPEALVELMRQFHDREVHKEYLALVHGRLLPKEGTIRLPMARSRHNRQSFSVDPDGKMAETGYVVEGDYRLQIVDRGLQNLYQQGFSLVRLSPKTGRTHQIRVHLAHFNHPLVGDTKYVGRKRARADVLWCSRQFLHAEMITFTHPHTGSRVTFQAPLQADLKAVLGKLTKL